MSIALQLRLCGKNINFVVALLLATPTELGNHTNKGEVSLLFCDLRSNKKLLITLKNFNN
jgi:hypothetical protein